MSPLESARTHGVYHPLEDARWLAIEGADAARYLQAMCTRDLGGLAPGASRFAALADDRGRYLADFHVLRPGDLWLLDAPAPRAGELARRLARFAVAEDVRVRDLAGEHRLWHAEGPGLARFAAGLPGIDEAGEAGVADREGSPVLWARRSRFGEPGCTWAVPAGAGAGFARVLAERAREAGWALARREEVETLRLEAGRPLGGVDVTEEDLLQEAGLTTAISLDKGCFPGQETLQRIARRGRLRRRLGGLELAEDTDLGNLAGAPVRDREDATAGRVTGAARSPRRGAIALAWLGESIEDGEDTLAVLAGERRIGARVAELPFVNGSAGRLPETPRVLRPAAEPR